MTDNKTITPPTENNTLKTALVTIIGRPSAGKSTFLNTAAGEMISIVSAVPQTTRNSIRGIVNTSLGQLVFVDTPGYHESEKKMNLRMRNIVADQLESSDCILYLIDSTRPCGDEEKLISNLLKGHETKLVAAVNKSDDSLSKPENAMMFLQKELPLLPQERIFTISAKNDQGINDILKSLYSLSPTAPQLYPEEFYTDQEVEFRIAEIIREQAINRLEQELPHCLYVQISDLEQKSPSRMWCRAFICVEKDSQKGIVIGKNASLIKTIRIESIKKLRKIFDYKIDLDLQVKVDKNWRQNDIRLNKIFNS